MTRELTLEEIKLRQKQLAQEDEQDQLALRLGRMGEAEAIERNTARCFQRRWLELEALLLKPQKTL